MFKINFVPLCPLRQKIMNELTNIQSKIHEIRGQRVMLDFDLAEMYGVETAQLKRQVRRNIERFEGDDFMFEVTWDELSRCQIGTMNVKQGQNVKYLPFAFTEMGVAMLSSVLRSPQAIQVNRGIMRVFVTMRHTLNTMALPAKVSELERSIENLRNEMNDILADQNDINESTRAQLDAISTALAELQAQPSKKPRPKIGFT
jgi:uncharacterized coiled-coil protein SlyX